MLFTVKEVSDLSKVTIKTLHHYHKIGLLQPAEISEAGYRLYGTKELERLQTILFYRELDFPLEQIGQLLDREPDRAAILAEQESLMQQRRERLDRIMDTLRKTKASLESGKPLPQEELFVGFEEEEAWREALQEQTDYLQEQYGIELQTEPIDVQEMNEQAAEAAAFMRDMTASLQGGVMHNDPRVQELIRDHLTFMNGHGHQVSAADFAAQTSFFMQDDFHLKMLEGQQIGLAYYLNAAAESYAKAEA
ncbi:MerR family DNA-binding transcriptional regulator [Paenibacillus sp. HJL G12]|uniref:MerR family DNA-binding transcriptional regulator n=1 Tax=Paenibacillus dendrobii TaxID=2691084 RepID=A0A7X3LJS7_9BACL|nr:MerR family transcriptional regulator [Paenibacillus dendrobii]MWV45848.1 MerR family DNA-binding transcriptional regulator [Paenibacillus dendrobii]